MTDLQKKRKSRCKKTNKASSKSRVSLINQKEKELKKQIQPAIKIYRNKVLWEINILAINQNPSQHQGNSKFHNNFGRHEILSHTDVRPAQCPLAVPSKLTKQPI